MVGWDDITPGPSRTWSSFEDKIVKKVMQKTGLIYNLNNLRQRCQAATGSRELNFEWFHDEYQDFPVRLSARKARWLRDMTVESLFRSFTRTTAFKEYERACEELGLDDREESLGIVFYWPGITAMILHNHPRDDELLDTKKEWTRIVRPIGNTNPRIIYTIEPLDSFLYVIGESWKPSR